MQFLKTLFWVILAVVAVIFSFNNWTVVMLSLWGGIVLEAKLPVLLLLAFLAGLVPTYLVLQARRWRLKRRLDTAERALADLRAATGEPSPAVVAEPPPVPSAAPASLPGSVPPGTVPPVSG